jgi:hypothetical protein
VAGQWFSPGTPISSTNKTDRHDITDINILILPSQTEADLFDHHITGLLVEVHRQE